MADEAELNSPQNGNGSDVDACVELTFHSSSATVLPQLDSADIIPEAAMKCGILPLDDDAMADLSDGVPTENSRLYFYHLHV